MNLRRLAFPFMLAAAAGYVALHSPLLRTIARAVGQRPGRCYFACHGWVANGRPADAAAGLVLLLLAAVAAALVARRSGLRRSEQTLVFGLLTIALVAVPAALLGWAGWAAGATPLRPPIGPLLVAVPSLGIILWGRRRGWRLPAAPQALPAVSPLVAYAASVALLLLLGTAVVALSHPPTGYDALSYHAPLAVYYWRDGNLGALLDRQPWAWALAHPGTSELWFGALLVAAGERVANLGQLPFALLGAVAAYAVGRRTGLGRGAAALGGAAFLLAPMVAIQSGMQLNDVAAGALVAAAAALALARPTEWTAARSALLGLALGLAATTKLATLPAVAAVGLFALATAVRAAGWRLALPAAGAFLVVVLPWWARNLVLFENPIFPAALPLIGKGYVVGDFIKKDAWFVPHPAAWPLYPLVESHGEMSGLGGLVAVTVLPGLLAALAWGRRPPVVLAGVVAGLSLPAWWLLTQHEPRLLLHLLALGCGFVGWGLVAVGRRHRRLAMALFAAVATFSALVTVDQALRPLASEPAERAEFYDRVWNVDPAAAALPETEPLLYHTGYARLSYAGDYPLLGPGLGRVLIAMDGAQVTDSLVAVMRPRGVRYAYVPAAPASRAAVEAMYDPARFELVHVSTVGDGRMRGVRRYLFRLRDR
jgi:hypothetical protein